jgi:acyl-CoA dehydrogenase
MILSVALPLLLALALLHVGRAFWAWSAPLALVLWQWHAGLETPGFLFWAVTALAGLVLVIAGLPAVRRRLITGHLLERMKPMFPVMSETERTALEAGTVWWDADLFTGRPEWKKLLAFQGPGLSAREQAFLDNEVEHLCRLVDGEQVDKEGDLSAEAWEYLKSNGFMGLLISEEHGGLGFSAEANSAIVTKVSSRNITLAVTVMVPNSLGPAELLSHYGTEKQKNYYLPRLAKGEEIPAFALTEPIAGSDAGAMTSTGVVCHGTWKGEKKLGILLNWNKRYITLAPIATLLGLAFKLKDPDHLMGDEANLGITCALVDTSLPGVSVGERHDPLGVKFLNGPTQGKDVFVPIDAIIGDKPMAGQGWRMLMDCLSAGRSISLPGLAAAGAMTTTRAVSAYTLLREQFGMPISRFEGIEEPLARIFGTTYWMDAARRLTAASVAAGQKPSVLSAIVKAYMTEAMRDVVNDGMDIQGGAGISRGPRNVLAAVYQGAPIGITVEGANILTRTMIIFGQGAIRCHPYAFAEMEAALTDDVKAFDRALFKHMGLVATNMTRSLLLGLTGGLLTPSPCPGPTAKHFARMTRLAACFEFTSELAMGSLGGKLKRKEMITGRLADALAWLYLGSATLKRFEDEGARPSDAPLMSWAMETAEQKIQDALSGVLDNLPNRMLGRVGRIFVLPLGRTLRGPSDRLSSEVARAVIADSDLRSRLTRGIYLPPRDEPGLGALDRGYDLLRTTATLRDKLKAAQKAGELPRTGDGLLELAVEKGILTAEERGHVQDALDAQWDLIQVDAFDAAAYLARCSA